MMRFTHRWMTLPICLAAACSLTPPLTALAQDKPLMHSHNFTSDRHGWRSWPQDQGPQLTPDTQSPYQSHPSLKVASTSASAKGLLYRYTPLQPGKLHEVTLVTRSQPGSQADTLPYRLQISFNKQDGGNGSAGKHVGQPLDLPIWKFHLARESK